MELDPDTDLSIDIDNLTSEFKKLSLMLYRYYKHKANAESQRDIAKSKLKEARAIAYKNIKMNPTNTKITEKGVEAEIDTDPLVLKANIAFIQAEHNATTWGGAVDSMKAKKDCLIQLGSDRRKEIGT